MKTYKHINKIFINLILLNYILLLFINHAAANTPLTFEDNFIKEPLLGKPALWLKGNITDTLVVIDPSKGELSPLSLEDAVWQVILRKSNGNVRFEMNVEPEYVHYEDPYYYLSLLIPEDIPADLFDLEVSIINEESTFTDTRPNAVKIVEEIKDRYSIIHVTDIHVDDPRGYFVNFSESVQNTSIKKMIRMVNLINPSFVILTGDNVFGAFYNTEYKHLYELLQGFDVPVFMTIGNHDAINHNISGFERKVDGMKVFEGLFAPLNFSFTYGDFKFISLNSMDWSDEERSGIGILTLAIGGQIGQKQLRWFEKELMESDSQLIVAGIHHPPHNSFQGQGAEELIELVNKYEIDAVLSGHTHQEEVLRDQSVLYLTTTSLMFSGFGGTYPAIRMLDIEDNELISWNYEEPKWSMPVYKDSYPDSPLRDLDVSALSCDYEPANDGKSTTVTATITNYLEKDFNEISVEFVMQKPQSMKSFEVIGGTVTDMYDTGIHQIWYVSADVTANSFTEVTIRQID